MKTLRFLIALLLLTASIHGANVNWSMQNILGIPSNRKITVATASGGAFTVGSNVVFGATEIQPTNGIAFTTNLAGLVYTVTIDGVSGSFRMDVPDDTNTYSAVDLIRRGLTLAQPQLHIAAGSNAVIITNNTLGIYTILVSATPTNITSATLDKVRLTGGSTNTGNAKFNSNVDVDGLLQVGNGTTTLLADGTAQFGENASIDPDGNLFATSVLTESGLGGIAADGTITATSFIGPLAPGTALPASQIVGAIPTNLLSVLAAIGPGLSGSTNGLVVTITTNGVVTNLLVTGITQFNPTNLNEAYIWYVLGHPGGNQLTIIAPRIGFAVGDAKDGVGAMQIGATYFDTTSGRGSLGVYYINGSKFGVATNSGTGYTSTLEWIANYWNGTDIVLSPVAERSEAMDTNGTVRHVVYKPTYGAVTANSAGPSYDEYRGPAATETWASTNANSTAFVYHGRLTRDAVSPSVSGTNYGVNWDATNEVVINLSTNLNLTNVPSVGNFTRTNQSDLVDLYLYPGLANYRLSWPTNWITNSAFSTNIPPSTIVKLALRRQVLGTTNYFADYSSYAYTPVIDTNAQSFFTAAASLNAAESNYINAFVVSAKAKGYWPQLRGYWPNVGSTSNSCSVNLVNPTNRIAWNGTSSTNFASTGVYGDGSAMYANTGLIPSSVIASPNSMMIGVWIRTATPNDSRFLGTGDVSSRADIQKNGTTFVGNGLNLFSSANAQNFSITNWTGFFGLNRTSSTSETPYVNGVAQIAATATATALSGSPLYIWARDTSGSADAFCNAQFSVIVFGEGLTAQMMTDLIADTAQLNAGLGR